MTDLKQLKCPGCGSSEIKQQSERLVKCGHCGSSLILKDNHLTSIGENSTQPDLKSKQPILIIGLFIIFVGLIFFISFDHNTNPQVVQIQSENKIKSPVINKVDPVEIEKRKKQNEATFTPKVEIINQVQAKTVVGGIYWIVQIKNISKKPVYRARVIVSLFDKNNKRVEEQNGWSIKEILQPEETSVVLALVAKPPKSYETFEITASASKKSFLLKNQVLMKVTDFVVNKNNNRYEIVGDVKNINDFNVNYTRVIAEALDSSGKPIGLAQQFSTQKALMPAESSGFKIASTTFITEQPATWKLWAIARKD